MKFDAIPGEPGALSDGLGEDILGAVGKRDKTKAGKSGAGRGKRSGVPDVGDVLRTAYQRTIDEKIPDEMLDLLGRLG